MRMPHGKFNELLNIIGPSVQKKDTVMRNLIGTLISNRRRRPDDGNQKRDISFETSLRMYKRL